MKKLFVLLLCLTLLPILPAMAGEAAQLPLFRVTMTDESGNETTIGSAMLYLSENLLLTALPVTDGDEDALTAYGPDGTAHEVVYIFEGLYGLRVLFIEPESNMTGVFSSWEEDAGNLLVGITANGLRYAEPGISVTRTQYEGLDAYLVSAKEPLLPGAMLLDDDGDVAGAAVAVWGEGENRYVVLPAFEMAEALLGNAKDEVPARSAGETVSQTAIEMTWDGGILTVDWSNGDVGGAADDSAFAVFFQDVDNLYYSYYLTGKGETSEDLYLVPGRQYFIWICPMSDGEVPDIPSEDDAQFFSVPDDDLFDDYGFTSDSYLAWAPINEMPEQMVLLPALEEITRQTLTDLSKSLYLQVTNTYAVDEEIEVPMLTVLRTPEDFVFFNVNGFIFGPEYQDNDVWCADVTGLFASYQEYGWGEFAPGEYTLSYTLGDMWGGHFVFTLE